MKIAVVGSRRLTAIDIGKHVQNADEIVSGGALGVDSFAAEYAKENGIRIKVFQPQYKHYGRAAPIVRNKEIVDYADRIVAFWDGKSKGTLSVIQYAEKTGKPCEVIFCE